MVSGMARCENCWVKHYGCSLVLAKEVMGGKGGPSGAQKVKVAEGSQTKERARKARKAITLGKSILVDTSILLKCECQNQGSPK